MPSIDKIKLTRSGSDWTVKASATATAAIYGKRPKKALEEIAVVLTVRDTGASPNPSRQPVLYRGVSWRTFDPGSKTLHAKVGFALPKKVDKKLSKMSAARRGKSITVNVVHVIDADGRQLAGRRTADHLKTAALDLATARARTSGSGSDAGALVSFYNNDQTLTPSGSDALAMSVNLVSNPVSCMQTSGSNESDFAALNVTGMQAGATTEGFIQKASGSQQAANEAPASTDVNEAMAEDYAEAVVETLLGLPLSWTTVVFDGLEELVELWLSGCDNNPGLYTIAATDALGNASSIGYVLDDSLNDGSTYTNKATSGNPGGIADATSAYNIFSANDDLGFGKVASFLDQAFLQNNYAPGPENAQFVITPPNTDTTIPSGITGSGGDSGLSFAGSSSSSVWPLAAVGGAKTSTNYPVLDFYLNWGPACSSQLGGAYGMVPDGKSGGVVPNYVYNPCQGWPTAPTPVSGAFPNAPTLTSVTPGSQSITATFTASTSSPTTNPPTLAATSYLVSATGSAGGSGQCTTSTTALSCAITGLPGGQTYTVTAAGVSSAGAGPASNSMQATLPASVPQPVNVTSLVAGNGTLTATWAAPADGGSPITSYTATAYQNESVPATCTTTALSCTITGLTNSTLYVVRVVATNAVGSSPQGAEAAGMPVPPPGVPSAPTSIALAPGSTSIVASWREPDSDGGSQVSGYTATATDGAGDVVATCSPTASSSPFPLTPGFPQQCTLWGLPPLGTYSVTVTATNSVGNGAPSAPMVATLSNLPDPVMGLEVQPGPTKNGKPTTTIVGYWDAVPPAGLSGLPASKYTMVSPNPDGGSPASCTFTGPVDEQPTCQLQGWPGSGTNVLYVTVTTAAGTSAPAQFVTFPYDIGTNVPPPGL